MYSRQHFIRKRIKFTGLRPAGSEAPVGGAKLSGGGKMLLSIIVTVTIAAAVIGSFCLRAVRLDKCRNKRSYVLVTCFEETDDLQHYVRSLYWDEVFKSSCPVRDIILLCGENEKAADAAKSISNILDNVYAVSAADLVQFLKQREVSENGE